MQDTICEQNLYKAPPAYRHARIRREREMNSPCVCKPHLVSAPAAKLAPIESRPALRARDEQRSAARHRPKSSPALFCSALLCEETSRARAQQSDDDPTTSLRQNPRYRLAPLTSTREPRQAVYSRVRATASPAARSPARRSRLQGTLVDPRSSFPSVKHSRGDWNAICTGADSGH